MSISLGGRKDRRSAMRSRRVGQRCFAADETGLEKVAVVGHLIDMGGREKRTSWGCWTAKDEATSTAHSGSAFHSFPWELVGMPALNGEDLNAVHRAHIGHAPVRAHGSW